MLMFTKSNLVTPMEGEASKAIRGVGFMIDVEKVSIFAARAIPRKRRFIKLTHFVRRQEKTKTHEFPDEAMRLADSIKPILANQESEIAGAALAELVSVWAAAHVVFGDAHETERLRHALLNDWVSAMRDLTARNAKVIGTDQPERTQ